MVTTGMVVVAGEITTDTYVEIPKIVRETVRGIGYDNAAYGFDCDTCGVITSIDPQSPDISQGVDEAYEKRTDVNDDDVLDTQGAGDQGMMFGFACTETPELMPLPIALAHKLARRLAEVRKAEILPYLRPDGKSQVTVRYEAGRPVEIVKVVLATQHAESADLQSIIYPDLIEHVVEPILPKTLYDVNKIEDITVINATGKFVIGGPMGDCGLTGRKIVVDTYGGAAPHGGGAFSGKDPSKVDRSGAYAARYVAKNVVAAGLAERCQVQVAYAIGVAHPVSVMVDCEGTEVVELRHRGAHQRALRPASGRHPARPRPAPAHLPEDRRLRSLRPQRPRLHVGTHRQGGGPARGRRARGADRALARPRRRRRGVIRYAAVFPLVRTRAFAEAFDYLVPPELEAAPGPVRWWPSRSARRPWSASSSRCATDRGTQGVSSRCTASSTSAHPRRPLELAAQVERYYLTSFAAALALVCPPTGALSVLRTWELTDGGRAALQAGEERTRALDGAKVSGGPAGRLAERYRRKGWVRVAYRVHVSGAAPVSRQLVRGEVTPGRLGPRQRAALELVEKTGAADELTLRAATGLSLPGLRRLVEAGRSWRPGSAGEVATEGPAPDPDRARRAGPAAPAVAQAARAAACATLSTCPTCCPSSATALHADPLRGAPRRGGAAARRHRQRQDGGVPAGRPGCAGGRPVGALPRARRSASPARPWRACASASPAQKVAVLHSGLTARERLLSYRADRRGRGAARGRRALGGLRAARATSASMVVDEEHDTSYKQESEPAYDARTVARWRRRPSGAVVVLGSATPSVEAYDRVPLHADLLRRVDGSCRRPWRSWTCATTTACSRTSSHGRSRRPSTRGRRPSSSSTVGASPRTSSATTAAISWMCPHCDVTLTLFAGQRLRCRTCGHAEPAPDACPECSSTDMVRHGFGTERLEREVQELLPGVELLRLDSDVAASYHRLRSTLDGFAAPGAKVLVGTQMIAKGHHFPEVTLVGVVNADVTLHFPDFRAEEHTFAMLIQVAGRSGRGERARSRGGADAEPRGAAHRGRREP